MNTILRTLGLAATGVLLAACALLQPIGKDDDARKAARVALAAYETTQQAALIYGRLKPCDPDPKSAFDRFCRNASVWAKIKAADKAAVTAIVAATPVLNAEKADAGELVAALAAIATVRQAVGEAVAQISGPKAQPGAT